MKLVKIFIISSKEKDHISADIEFKCKSCKNHENCADKTSCKMISQHMLRQFGGLFGKKYSESVSYGHDKMTDTETLYIDTEHDFMKMLDVSIIIRKAIEKNIKAR